MGLFDSWGRKCKLTIQASQVPADLTNFPILLDKNTLPSEMLDADGSYPALNGGGDLRFSSDEAGNTRLACEVVVFVTDNNPTNGKAEIWVKVASVSSSSNTDIWVWYNKSGESQPAVTDTYGRNSVWSNGFKGVYHLQEVASGGTETAKYVDSTGNNSNADKVESGSGDVVTNTSSKIQNGQTTDVDGYIDLHNGSDLRITGKVISLSLWAYPVNDGATGGTRLISKRQSSTGKDEYALIQEEAVFDNELNFRINNGSTNSGLDLVKNAWNHCFGTYDGNLGSNNMITYLNGTAGGQRNYTTDINDSTIQVCLGHRYQEARWFDGGTLDEVRIAEAHRSSGWINAEYNNQNSPSTFVVEGTPEPASAVSPSGIPSAEAFGSPQLNLGIQPSGIGTAEAFGTASVSPGNVNIQPSGIPSEEAFGGIDVTYPQTVSLIGSGIASAEAFGSPILGAVIVPAGIASAEAVGFPSVSSAGSTLSPSGIVSGETFGTPQINQQVLPEGIPTGEAFGSPRLDRTLPVTGISSAEAFGNPTVLKGTATVSPGGIPSAEAFGSPSLDTGATVIAPAGIASAETFGNPELDMSVGAQGIGSGEAFGVPAVSPSYDLQPSGIGSAETFGNPQVNRNLTPAGIESGEAFGSPQLDMNVSPGGIPSAEAFGSLSISVNISVQSIPSAEAFGTPTAAIGVATVSPSGIESAESFGEPNIAQDQTIQVGGIPSEEAFGDINVAFDQFIQLTGIASLEAFGEPEIFTFTRSTFQEYVDGDLENEMLSVEEFGEMVSYTYRNNDSTVQINGIFDNEYTTVDPDTGVGLQSSQPVFWTATRYFTRKPGPKDLIVIRGEQYRVIRHEPDGTGLSMLFLHHERTI